MSDYDLNSIKRHSFTARFGSVIIAPLADEPEFEFERSVEESTIYENGGEEPVAAFIQKNMAVITLDTKDVYTALELLGQFSTGDDIMAPARLHPLTFTPQVEGEKTLTFPCAFLNPEGSYVPGMGEDHIARLIFKAIPDPGTGKLFLFA
ncbi:MAG: hypothetical protein J6W00_02060 [Lentisphaeria bacterium]|nr:hypothetical protein [Lentisphaeria bacterium]